MCILHWRRNRLDHVFGGEALNVDAVDSGFLILSKHPCFFSAFPRS
jgi:hypothetical protein